MNPDTTTAAVAASFHQPTAPAGLLLAMVVLAVLVAIAYVTWPRKVHKECADCGYADQPTYPTEHGLLCAECIAGRAARRAS